MRGWNLGRTRQLALAGACGLSLVPSTGCANMKTPFDSYTKKEPPISSNGSGVMQASYAEAVGAVPSDENWSAAEGFYTAQDYAKAEKKFHAVAENTKNPPLLAEKARFYEAECLRVQRYYPKAADTYSKLLNDFPTGVYREKAVAQMYGIADFWLEETRADTHLCNRCTSAVAALEPA